MNPPLLRIHAASTIVFRGAAFLCGSGRCFRSARKRSVVTAAVLQFAHRIWRDFKPIVGVFVTNFLRNHVVTGHTAAVSV